MDAHKQREMLERLRAHLEHKTTGLSAYALKVPAEHYVSDDQLALEVEVGGFQESAGGHWRYHCQGKLFEESVGHALARGDWYPSG